MTKDTLIYWQPTSRSRLYLCIDSGHYRWTTFHPKDKDTPEHKICFRGSLLTKDSAQKILKSLCGRLYLEGLVNA